MLAPLGEFVGVDRELLLECSDALGVFVEQDLCRGVSKGDVWFDDGWSGRLTVPYALENPLSLCSELGHASSGATALTAGCGYISTCVILLKRGTL